MRIAISLLVAVALSTNALIVDESEKHHALVARAVQEAEAWYERLLVNATINGAQSRRSTKSNPETEALDRAYSVYDRAYEILTGRDNLEHSVASQYLRQATTTCNQITINCNINDIYRSPDGQCNNINNRLWGAAGAAQNRLFAPFYADNQDEPRGGGFRQSPVGNLPNPRVVSRTVHIDRNVPFPPYSNMLPQFGQFLDHDLSITPEAGRQCCAGNSDPNCWPIQLSNDDFYNPRGSTCMDFTRSTPCRNPSNGKREQTNMNTGYLDASQVYGSSKTRSDQLRTFRNGTLITNNQGFNGFLPAKGQVGNPNVQGTFAAGDDRINEMPGLAVMHNVFIMEHNRIAAEFRRIRPNWNDEQLFQETRRIVAAELQQVTYNEYLPAILGTNTMNSFSLWLPSPGQYSSYQSNVDATILNEFSTAAYRFAHSLVSGLVSLLNEFNSSPVGSYSIKDQYFQSEQITQSGGRGYDWILKGLMETNCQKFDRFATTGLTQFLFAQKGAAFGSDLFTRNINRGRDHGLNPYSTYREDCGGGALSFTSQPSDMSADSWNALRTAYSAGGPLAVDLFSGAVSEDPIPGAASGRTFNCIKAKQFQRTKNGDRFFFTHAGGNPGNPYPFTTAQLQYLRSQTLGDIICRNSQQDYTNQNVFFIPSSNK